MFNRNYANFGPCPGLRSSFLALSTLPALMFCQTAFASNITVANPVNGTKVASTVWVRAHNVGCNGVRPHRFGYSIDNSSAITWGVTAYDIDAAKVPVSPGKHTIHFKSWNLNGGLCPVVNTTFTASAPKSTGSGSTSGNGSSNGNGSASGNGSSDNGGSASGNGSSGTGNASGNGNGTGTASDSGSSNGSTGNGAGAVGVGTGTPEPPVPPISGLIPVNAVASDNLDGKSWLGERDQAIKGDARGSTVYPATTPLYDDAREFYMTYSSRGGMRWHISFAKDTNATHFVYDTYVYIVDPTQVANIELDMNQVMADGRTVILGTQCSVYSKTWEYTLMNAGTHWHPSNIPCNPQTWAANTWHHIQIASHRDDQGNVGYDWVNFDGTHSEFQNATGGSADHLGWQKGTLLINFQLDGASKDGGTIQAYAHELTVLRW